MNDTLKSAAIFFAGVILGSVVTWKIVKTKCEEKAQKEIDSVKEVFAKKKTNSYDSLKEEDPFHEKADEKEILEHTSWLKKAGYIQDDGVGKGDDNMERPYVIEPEEFGMLPDYEMVSLTYYEDGILTDDMDELVEEVDETVGLESLAHFGEYEEDAVHVRNDKLKTDYEILRDLRTYEEVAGR